MVGGRVVSLKYGGRVSQLTETGHSAFQRLTACITDPNRLPSPGNISMTLTVVVAPEVGAALELVMESVVAEDWMEELSVSLAMDSVAVELCAAPSPERARAAAMIDSLERTMVLDLVAFLTSIEDDKKRIVLSSVG